MLPLACVDKMVLLLPSIILSVSTKSSSALFTGTEIQPQMQHQLLRTGADVARGSRALALWGQLSVSPGSESCSRGMRRRRRSCVPHPGRQGLLKRGLSSTSPSSTEFSLLRSQLSWQQRWRKRSLGKMHPIMLKKAPDASKCFQLRHYYFFSYFCT